MEMNRPGTPAAPAAGPAVPPAAPPPPHKVRRVGTFAFALVLIAAGILLLVHIAVPSLDLLAIARFAPALLIVLGVEVLIYASRPGVVLKYDFVSMVACAFILVLVGGASVLPQLWDAYGPGYDTRINRLEYRLESEGCAALEAVPALRDVVSRANFYVYNADAAVPDLGDDLQALAESGTCHFGAGFTLDRAYTSAQDFADDCARVLAACKGLPLGSCSFSSVTRSDSDEPYQSYSLDLTSRWQMGQAGEQLAASVDSRWCLGDSVFASRAELDSYLARLTDETREDELLNEGYGQGYTEGYTHGYDDANAGAEFDPYSHDIPSDAPLPGQERDTAP